MKNWKSWAALPPLWFGLLPILSVYLAKTASYSFSQIFRPVLLTVAAAELLLLAFHWVTRDWACASLISTYLVILFFTLGNIHLPDGFLQTSALQLGLWAVLALGGIWALIRFLPHPIKILPFLNLAGAVLVVVNLVNIGVYKVRTSIQESNAPLPDLTESLVATPTTTSFVQRDVYYIILDGYTRSDVLKELYHVNNSEFLNFLNRSGFSIAQDSYSNYSQTQLSLTSSLNMQYLPDLLALDPQADDRNVLNPVFNQNAVIEFFRARGYQIYTFFPGISITPADTDVLISRSEQLNESEIALLQDSVGNVWLDEVGRELYWQDTLKEYERMQAVAAKPGPKFVLAHILDPHPPFVVNRAGELIENQPYSYDDGSHYAGTDDQYAVGYVEQLLYANSQVEKLVTSILAQPGPDPIIIIQGDHGSGMLLDQNSYENTCVRERMAILNAYYLPDRGFRWVYPGISPVNSFRLVLNHYFGANLDLLPDEHYFSTWPQPFDFHKLSSGELSQPCAIPTDDTSPTAAKTSIPTP
jgi:hypothetical protein